MQFVHTVDDYAENIADTQRDATFELGKLIIKPSSAAVHWYHASWAGVRYATDQPAAAATRYVCLSPLACICDTLLVTHSRGFNWSSKSLH
jgi:hypothetical protein